MTDVAEGTAPSADIVMKPVQNTADEPKEGDASTKEEMKVEREDDPKLVAAMEVMEKGNKSVAFKSACGQISKMIKAVQKKPAEEKKRKLPMANMVVKKFVVGTKGGFEFLQVLGWTKITEKKGTKDADYLYLAEGFSDAALRGAVALLQDKIDGVKKALAQPRAPAVRKKCEGGCGFWGDEQQDGYCSLCYKKKFMGIKTTPDAGKPKQCIKDDCSHFGAEKFNWMCSVCFHKDPKNKKVPSWRKKLDRAMVKIRAVRAFKMAKRLQQKHKNRCWKCKRKIGITGIECRCGYIFCGKHRYADEHNCEFDHKQRHKKKLKKDNATVMSSKFDRIDDA